MNRKSRTRNHHFPSTTSTHAALLANFRQQMADHARGERLQKLRTERRLTQEDAAHEIGVSAKTLRTWEKGGPIKWENAKSAGEFYEVDPETLVGREVDGPNLMGSLASAEPRSLAEKLDEVLNQQALILAELSAVRDELKRLRSLPKQDGRGRASRRS